MKKTLLMVWAIVFLLLANLISLYFLLRPQPDPAFIPEGGENPSLYLKTLRAPDFKQPMDDSTAQLSVDTYRKNLRMGSYGVIYDVNVMQRYLTTVYPELKKKMGRDTANYTWKLGFYWMITKVGNNNNRLSFCVVPTLVSKTDSTKAIDYFNDTLQKYNHYDMLRSAERQPPPGDSGFVYNEGQLWP